MSQEIYCLSSQYGSSLIKPHCLAALCQDVLLNFFHPFPLLSKLNSSTGQTVGTHTGWVTFEMRHCSKRRCKRGHNILHFKRLMRLIPNSPRTFFLWHCSALGKNTITSQKDSFLVKVKMERLVIEKRLEVELRDHYCTCLMHKSKHSNFIQTIKICMSFPSYPSIAEP